MSQWLRERGGLYSLSRRMISVWLFSGVNIFSLAAYKKTPAHIGEGALIIIV
jgi:hypothetical protein